MTQYDNHEEIKGIITDVRLKLSMFKSRSLFLIPTTKRLVFFIKTSAIEKKAMDDFAASLEGQGFADRLKANLSSSNRMMPFFKDKRVEDILSLSPESFYVDYNEITKVKFPGFISIGNQKNLYRVKVETSSATHELFFDPQRNTIPDAKAVLKTLIPDKIA